MRFRVDFVGVPSSNPLSTRPMSVLVRRYGLAVQVRQLEGKSRRTREIRKVRPKLHGFRFFVVLVVALVSWPSVPCA